jgi:hypothetical protein
MARKIPRATLDSNQGRRFHSGGCTGAGENLLHRNDSIFNSDPQLNLVYPKAEAVQPRKARRKRRKKPKPKGTEARG